MKKKMTTETVVKGILKRLIRNMAIVGTVIALVVLIALFFGPEVNLDLRFFTRLTVVSIILCISIIVVYELWCKTGQNKAREEDDYNELLKEYDRLSLNMDYSTMQEYLDYEEKRRYNVEYDRLTRLIVRDTDLLDKMTKEIEERKKQASTLDTKIKNNRRKARKLLRVSIEDRIKMSTLRKRIKWNTRKRTNIVIKLPYVKAEEFDYLRYNLNTESFKEYSPNDTKRYLRFHRSKRYIQSITVALFGINMLSFGTAMAGNIWYGIFMTVLSIVALLATIVSGYSVGYKSVSIISAGVYKTANEYISKAQVYCERNNKVLYYKEPPKYEYDFEESVEEKIEKDTENEKLITPEDKDKKEVNITVS